MGKDLSHLTSEEIETLMRRYYDGEAVSKLIKEYNISVHASELYKLFPPEVYQNYSCEYCDEFLVINRPSKTTKDFPKYRFLALLLKFSVTQKYGRRGLVALAPIFQFSAI